MSNLKVNEGPGIAYARDNCLAGRVNIYGTGPDTPADSPKP